MTSDLTTLLGDMFGVQILQVTLLILLVGLVARLFFHNRPFLALALWTIVLIKCVTPPVFFARWACSVGSALVTPRSKELAAYWMRESHLPL